MAQRAWSCENWTRLRMRGVNLQKCTEVLGSESSECGEDTVTLQHIMAVDGVRSSSCEIGEPISEDFKSIEENLFHDQNSRKIVKLVTPHKPSSFPPPLESITTVASPHPSEQCSRLSLLSHKSHGRFVLREAGFMPQEIFRASRKDGRLRLELVHACEWKSSTQFNNCTEGTTQKTMDTKLQYQDTKFHDQERCLLIDKQVQKDEADQIDHSNQLNFGCEITSNTAKQLQTHIGEAHQSKDKLQMSMDTLSLAPELLLTHQNLSEIAFGNPQTSTVTLPLAAIGLNARSHDYQLTTHQILFVVAFENAQELDAHLDKACDLALSFKEQPVLPLVTSQCKQHSECPIPLGNNMWDSSILVNLI